MSAKSISKLLVTGATGLVGSKFVDNFKHKFNILTIGRDNVDIKIDLTSQQEVVETILSTDADAVINFAAYTNVDGAEEEKGNKEGEVYTLNAKLPLWLAHSCAKSGKNLYYISTDYVFDGNKASEPYTEEDLPKPVDSWYAISKLAGELNIKEGFGVGDKFAIIRISFPYSGTYNRKLDFARVVIDKLGKGEVYYGITDQKIKPTSVDDIANAIDLLLRQKAKGIYHVAGKYPNGFISPYDFALNIASIMNLDSSLIKPISFVQLSEKRIAPRPQHTWLDTKKIESMGMNITNIDQSLVRFKEQFIRRLKNQPF